MFKPRLTEIGGRGNTAGVIEKDLRSPALAPGATAGVIEKDLGSPALALGAAAGVVEKEPGSPALVLRLGNNETKIIVVPAKAGIQFFRSNGEKANWVPAFAGMTALLFCFDFIVS